MTQDTSSQTSEAETQDIRTDRKFPEDAMKNGPQDIEFCGKTYQFMRPQRRRAIYLQGISTEIIGKAGVASVASIVEEGSAEDISEDVAVEISGKLMQAVPDILDFIYTALDIDKKEQKRIEEVWEFPDVMRVFNALTQVLNRPLDGSSPSSDPEPEAEADGTENGTSLTSSSSDGAASPGTTSTSTEPSMNGSASSPALSETPNSRSEADAPEE